MAVSVNGLKTYLRLPSDSTEDLTVFLSAAKASAAAAGIPDYSDNALYDIFLYGLASIFYDYREMDASPDVMRFINAFALQLRCKEEEETPSENELSSEEEAENQPEEEVGT